MKLGLQDKFADTNVDILQCPDQKHYGTRSRGSTVYCFPFQISFYTLNEPSAIISKRAKVGVVQKPVVRSLKLDVVSELLVLIALFNSKEA